MYYITNPINGKKYVGKTTLLIEVIYQSMKAIKDVRKFGWNKVRKNHNCRRYGRGSPQRDPGGKEHRKKMRRIKNFLRNCVIHRNFCGLKYKVYPNPYNKGEIMEIENYGRWCLSELFPETNKVWTDIIGASGYL